MLMVSALPLQAQTAGMAIFPQDAACYQRIYSRSHLDAHPVQQVTMIKLGPADGQMVSALLVVDVSVEMRGKTESYVGSAYCIPTDAGLSCGMEGDAGGFTLRVIKAGGLLLTVDKGGMTFEGETDFVPLSGSTGDDREFLLHPLAAADCP